MPLHIFSNHQYYYYIYVFTFYAFIGWCLETPFHSIKEKKFVNRGFLYGPFCPIYGVGCILLIKFLSPLQNNLVALYITSCLITSALEYATGYAMETLFENKWWDYSDNKFNLHGRICLQYSLFWGVGSVFVIKVLHPLVDNIIASIPLNYNFYICAVIIIYFIVDSILTIISVIELQTYLSQLNELSLEIKSKVGSLTSNALDRVGEIKSNAADKANGLKTNAANKVTDVEKIVQELKNRYENIIHNATKNSSRLIKAFPDLTSKKFSDAIKDIKKKMNKESN